MLGICPELCDGLRDEDVKPVQAFGLVRIDIVVCLAEDGVCGQGRRVAEDGGTFLVQGLRRMARGGGAEGQERAFVC